MLHLIKGIVYYCTSGDLRSNFSHWIKFLDDKMQHKANKWFTLHSVCLLLLPIKLQTYCYKCMIEALNKVCQKPFQVQEIQKSEIKS